jgi:hypothetical protein
MELVYYNGLREASQYFFLQMPAELRCIRSNVKTGQLE